MSGDDSATILVVDDVPENVRLLEAVLASRGYDVISATDGHAALELAESAKPDLVLLDVVMPQPDGYAVCRRLREREETALLPVIMLTASIGPEKTQAIGAGADDFIPKPCRRSSPRPSSPPATNRSWPATAGGSRCSSSISGAGRGSSMRSSRKS
jgi:adenylate cyclase